MRFRPRHWFLLVGLATAALLAVAPFFGADRLDLGQVFRAGTVDHRIFFELRLPRILFLCFVGGSLASLGAIYQILFHNPLAEPYILGVSSAVTLGIVLAEIVFHFTAYSPVWIAAGGVGALVATVLLLVLYLTDHSHRTERIVLFGMGLNFTLSSAVFLLLSYAYQQMGGGSMRWIFGQIPWLSTREVAWFVGLSIPLLGAEWLMARHLDALSLGDGVSRTLGFSPKIARSALLVVTSAHIALIVAFSGSIGFVGLVVPHTVRLLFRPPSSRVLGGLSFLLGSVFLSYSDIASRTLLPPFEFPIGIITTLFGGPLFLFLLWRKS